MSRLRSMICIGSAAAAAGTVVLAATGPVEAVTARPTLTFANGSTQAIVGAAYTKALSNVLDTNTVS